VNSSKNLKQDPREVLALAERAASRKSFDEALNLFEVCAQGYLRKSQSYRAIAVAKRARTVLGPIPKIRALIIRLYSSTGLHGDARQEYLLAETCLRKKEIPLFRILDEESFIDLLSMVEMVHVLKGRAVFRQDEKSSDVYVILSGTLEVLRDATRVGTMIPGDFCGELGFFSQKGRTATVRAVEKCILIRIPSASLSEFQLKHPEFHRLMESVYDERILKKAREDLGSASPRIGTLSMLATLNYPKGNEIPMNDHEALAIIKHGVVEIDYDDRRLRRKEYLKAGSIIPKGHGRARANTNVVIMVAGTCPEERNSSKK